MFLVVPYEGGRSEKWKGKSMSWVLMQFNRDEGWKGCGCRGEGSSEEVPSARRSFDYASHSVGCAQDDRHGWGHSTGVSRNHAQPRYYIRRFHYLPNAHVILSKRTWTNVNGRASKDLLVLSTFSLKEIPFGGSAQHGEGFFRGSHVSLIEKRSNRIIVFIALYPNQRFQKLCRFFLNFIRIV